MPPSKRSASPVTTGRRSTASPSWPGARGSPSTSTPRARTTCSAGSRRRQPPRCGRRSRRSRTSRPTRAAMPRCWRASHASPTSSLGTSRSSGRSKQRRKPTTPSPAARPRSPDGQSAASKRGSTATDLSPRLLDPTVELLDTGVISALSRMSILRAAAPEHYRRERVDRALADVVHRALFGVLPGVNVRPRPSGPDGPDPAPQPRGEDDLRPGPRPRSRRGPSRHARPRIDPRGGQRPDRRPGLPRASGSTTSFGPPRCRAARSTRTSTTSRTSCG